MATREKVALSSTLARPAISKNSLRCRCENASGIGRGCNGAESARQKGGREGVLRTQRGAELPRVHGGPSHRRRVVLLSVWPWDLRRVQRQDAHAPLLGVPHLPHAARGRERAAGRGGQPGTRGQGRVSGRRLGGERRAKRGAVRVNHLLSRRIGGRQPVWTACASHRLPALRALCTRQVRRRTTTRRWRWRRCCRRRRWWACTYR